MRGREAATTPPPLQHSGSTSDMHSPFERQPSAPSLAGENSMSFGGASSQPELPDAAGAPPQGLEASPVWLECGPDERYLLLEDMDTGDMLMPLSSLRPFFQANYGRKVSNPLHHLVQLPPGEGAAGGRRHWIRPFEAPPHVKALLRREVDDRSHTPGHVRLTLLPVVFNAMRARSELQATALFKALERALRRSAYWPLLQPAGEAARGSLAPQPSAESLRDETNADEAVSTDQETPLFQGPRSLAATALKYMSARAAPPPKKRARTEPEPAAAVAAAARAQADAGRLAWLEGQVERQAQGISVLRDELSQARAEQKRTADRLAQVDATVCGLQAALHQVLQLPLPAQPLAAQPLTTPPPRSVAPAQQASIASLLTPQPPWGEMPQPPPSQADFADGRGSAKRQRTERGSRTPPPMRRPASLDCLNSGLPTALPPAALTDHLLGLPPSSSIPSFGAALDQFAAATDSGLDNLTQYRVGPGYVSGPMPHQVPPGCMQQLTARPGLGTR